MVTVAEELPFAAIVKDDSLATTCSNCFATNIKGLQLAQLKRCVKCHTVYYCSKECQREDWKHHKYECIFMVKAVKTPCYNEIRLISRVIMRIKKGDVPVAFNGRTFDGLIDHAEDLTAKPMMKVFLNVLYKSLMEYMGTGNVPSKEEVISIFGKLRTNSFGIAHSSTAFHGVGSAIYLGLSAHDHSCQPDCNYTFIGSKIILRAKDPQAKYSKALLLPYVDLALPRRIRQEKLQNSHFFDCQCVRCMDEEENLWEGSGRSACCPDDGVVLPRNNGEPLVCSKCERESSLTFEQINKANRELVKFCHEEKIEELKQQCVTSRSGVDAYKKLFEDMQRILSPFNLYLFNLSQFMKEILTIFNLVDEALALRFSYADLKISKRFRPFSNGMTTAKRCIYNIEKKMYDKDRSKLLLERVSASGKEISVSLNEICGPEDPLTKEVQKEVNMLAMMKMMFEKR